MSATQVSIRLGVEGPAEVRRTFEDASRAGEGAFRRVNAAADQTGCRRPTDAALAPPRRSRASSRTCRCGAGSLQPALGVDPTSGAGPAKASAVVFEKMGRTGAAANEHIHRIARGFGNLSGVASLFRGNLARTVGAVRNGAK